MKKVNIATGTTVKISKKSRALLERAHNDGLIRMYSVTFMEPSNDKHWKYFKLFECGEWTRTDIVGTIISVEELEDILYPKPQVTLQDSIVKLVNQEIERIGIENVTPLEKALLKTLGIYPPQEIKVYDKGEHVATVTKDKLKLNAGEYSKEVIFKLKAAYEKLNK